jgi:hypothetical protein
LVTKRRVLMTGGAVMALFAMVACGWPAQQPDPDELPGTVLDVAGADKSSVQLSVRMAR